MTRAMPSRVRPSSSDLSPEDFDAIRDAVMETARGRWFLDEYAARLRTAETAGLLDGLKRLEKAVAANHDAMMARLADALLSDDEDLALDAPQTYCAEEPVAELAPRHMKFYRGDEDIFEPAPHATIAAVPEPKRPVLVEPEAPDAPPQRQRIVIIRHKAGESIDVPLMADDFAKAS
jgi:hypothetical protein